MQRAYACARTRGREATERRETIERRECSRMFAVTAAKRGDRRHAARARASV
jgi:hypothetical protein